MNDMTSKQCAHVPVFAAGAGQIAREVTPCLRCEIERLQLEFRLSNQQAVALRDDRDRVRAVLERIARFPDQGLDGANASYMRSYAKEALSDSTPVETPRYYCKNCDCADCGNTRRVEPARDVAALLAVQQENKRLRGALAAISVGTPDLLPPYRVMSESQLRGIARKALEGSPEEPRPNEVELFDGESHIHRRSESTAKDSSPCSYCFGDKTVSMSDGSKRMCELCGGTGRVEVKASEPPCGCSSVTNGLGGVSRIWCGKHWAERGSENGPEAHNKGE